MLKKLSKWSLVALIIFLVGGQLIRPARTNPQVDPASTIEARTHMTPEVAAILARGCGDCHSHNTVWPWYSNVAPVSWFVINHVNGGRSHMDLSNWAAYDQRKQDRILTNMCGQIEEGEMPLSSYLLLHHNSKLSPDDIKKVCDWTRDERQRISASSQTNAKDPAQVDEHLPGG